MVEGLSADRLKESLSKAGLVPGPAEQVVRNFEPTINLQVTFAGKAVDLGTHFRSSECKVAPAIAFQPEAQADVDSRASYTIMLVDCDAGGSDDGVFRNWVLPGLQPLTASSDNMVGETKWALTPYLGPELGDDSKPHRCLFLLYREPKNLDMSKSDLDGDEFDQRKGFKPSEFAEKHGLVLVGVNWMTCGAG